MTDEEYQALAEKNKRIGDGATLQLVLTLIASALVAVGLTFSYFTQQGNHKEQAARAGGVETRNEFWKQLAGEEPFATKTNPGKLARDISPLLDPAFVESIPESALIPQTIETITVPDGAYGEIRKELAMNVFEGENVESSQGCLDCGRFDDGFVAKARIAKAGDWQGLQDPIPAVDTSYEFTPDKMPVWMFWGPFALILSSIAFVIAWLTDSDRTQYGYRLTRHESYWRLTRPFCADGLDLNRMGPLVLAPAVGVPRLLFNVPFGGWRYLDDKMDAARAEKERIAKENAPSPVSSELALARSNYQRLLELPAAQQALPEVKKAVKDTAALISELQQFPQEMSAKAARLMAKQILADNQDLRDRPKAVLEADDEVHLL